MPPKTHYVAILNVCWDAGFCILSARLSSGFAKATYVFKVQYNWSAGFGGGGWRGKGMAEFSTLAKGGLTQCCSGTARRGSPGCVELE